MNGTMYILYKQSLYSSVLVQGDFGRSLIFFTGRAMVWRNPCMPLAEPSGSTEPRLKNTAIDIRYSTWETIILYFETCFSLLCQWIMLNWYTGPVAARELWDSGECESATQYTLQPLHSSLYWAQAGPYESGVIRKTYTIRFSRPPDSSTGHTVSWLVINYWCFPKSSVGMWKP